MGTPITTGASFMSKIEMGYAMVDITPQAGSPSGWMTGYGWGPRGNYNWAAARPLRAQCLVIYDDDVPNILLRIDVLGLPREVHRVIRDRVVAANLVESSSDLIVAASHTHSGPFLGHTYPSPVTLMGLQPPDVEAIDEYTTNFMESIFQLVVTARAAARTAITLDFLRGEVSLAVNREGLAATPPTDVPVLALKATTDGSLRALMFGYACHPVSRGFDTVYDSDYCGYAALAIEQSLNVPALFFQGTAGDLNPDSIGGEAAISSMGDRLANAVIAALDTAVSRPVTGPIQTLLDEIDLPLSSDTSNPFVIAELRARYQDRVDALGTGFDADGAAHRHAQLMLDELDQGTLPSSIPMLIQRWRFDGLTILALAHEVVSGYTESLQDLFTDTPLWVMAYANEVSCYVPSDELLWEGGSSAFNGYAAGWNNGDSQVVGVGTSMIPFPWPTPLKASPQGTSPAVAKSCEGQLVAACLRMLLD